MSRVKVAVLGATGSVGQRFIQLLDHHPFFEVTHLCASENSAGKTYGEVMKTRWKISSDIPAYAKNLVITTPDPAKTKDVVLAFSGLDSNVAGEVEKNYANAGIHIISNSKNHRMDPTVPILSAEVNSSHLEVLTSQKRKVRLLPIRTVRSWVLQFLSNLFWIVLELSPLCSFLCRRSAALVILEFQRWIF
ncbi:putative dihydrodipicolinate reductase domain protein [Leptospira interrogans serovar Australis str. 200703203]|uniref:Putative dihydrodipicolinate reductase domain protein n=1 Tax=Leptospira interrogans serovar Australis str. 200703203 TaxID=1085541 RepID=N1UJZ8_LEPIR|nr:putative dihydrodipicolinate reductase domain protein [Leptospira interrogans serovar Australis str. 200703203]